ncbi:Protein AKNAD1 [Fukomys damarensis]|uniref:Protein AKNAD1 n=1 Tax=Fukomys damarensis TaxID=885580 RepID=A0A091CTP2_FUKDA|nr:Protein AKNAD1 [Fukomys damarensis]
MDETDFSEDTTYKQQEDLPYDDTVSQMKMCNDGNFTSKNNILGVSDQVIPTEDDPLEKAPHNESYRNPAVAMTWERITENDFLVDKKGDKEKQCFMTLYSPADEGDALKSNISDILLHHLSKDQFLGGQSIDCETLPEISHADSSDEAAIITNVSSCYVKNFWSKEKTPESLHQLNPKRDGENSSKSSCSPSSSDLEEQVAIGNQENSKNLTKITGLSDKQKSCQRQEPQKQLTEKGSLSNVFKCGQGQVHYQLPDFSKVAPKVKISKNNLISKSLTMAKQASSSPKLRNKSTIVQDILENLSRSNCVEKQYPERKRKITETSQQIQGAPVAVLWENNSTHRLTVNDSSDLTATGAGATAGTSPSAGGDFLATKGMHLALQQQIHKHEPPAVGDFDPERKQKMERKGLRRINCGRFSIVVHEKASHQDSALGFDTRSGSSDSSSGWQHNKCEHCGTETQNSRRDCSKDPLEAFHYRYNTPGQYYLNHSRRDAFVQSCSLDENKNSAPSCSKPKQLCSQKVNSISFQDECEPTLGERNLKTFMTFSADPAILPPHFQSCKISGSKSLCDFNSIEKTESKILNSALDRALKTATILKKTTDQMIKVITEDLAKAQRWRNQLKY